jgi:hypothetical protein
VKGNRATVSPYSASAVATMIDIVPIGPNVKVLHRLTAV